MRNQVATLLVGSFIAMPAIASTDQQVGMAVGLAAAIRCSVEKNLITEAEEIPLLEYHLEKNKIEHLNEYLSSDKGQTATRIVVSSFMDDKCNISTKDRKEMQRLNKLILFYAPDSDN